MKRARLAYFNETTHESGYGEWWPIEKMPLLKVLTKKLNTLLPSFNHWVDIEEKEEN